MNILCRSVLAPELKGVPYVTVMDIWTTSCLLFVLSALIIQLIVVFRTSNRQHSKVLTFASSILVIVDKMYIILMEDLCGIT